jgi:Ca-activated chloride channel family protein
VVHYGDITMTFLNSWFRADRRDASLTYASAVAIEEKSVVDYNLGNPDGVLDPGEEARPPKIPLVAVYPSEGTLFSDNPFYVLDAPWVDDQEKAAAHRFESFLQEPANQTKVLESGFRPGNPSVAIGSPIVPANHVDPTLPRNLLSVPEPSVLVKLLDQWAATRKSARVLLVLDVSGSMGEEAGKTGQSKLDLAKLAVTGALDQFDTDDEVGLRIFSTNVGPPDHPDYLDVQPLQPIGESKEQLRASIEGLQTRQNTPLFTAARDAYQKVLDGYDPARINAVILLTDGKNDDTNRTDDAQQLQDLLDTLRNGSQGEGSKPVRMFTVGYGSDADMSTLKTISEASNAAAYNATDASTITKVFTQVVSNF